MRINRITPLFICFLFFVNISQSQNDSIYWPVINKDSKTWTRWWWMGSAVNKKNITQSLITFERAGIGGVEIEPIYGVKGQEKNFINFLSPYWIEMLNHTVRVADSLQMGVDLTLGTGWPWGGSNVKLADAAKRLLVRKVNLKKGTLFSERVSPFETGTLIYPDQLDIKVFDSKKVSRRRKWGFREVGSIWPKLIGVYAFDTQNNLIDLSNKIINEKIEWENKNKDFDLFFVFEDQTRQKVKRAAPGGEGWVLDHFSTKALKNYLQLFSSVLEKSDGKIRSVFNDSYEVYKADYTQNFF